MKQISLLMNQFSIQAYMRGEKTQTRRPCKLTPELRRMKGDLSKAFVDGVGSGAEYLHVPCTRDVDGSPWERSVQRLFCPYGEPGDGLYFRETWSDFGMWIDGKWHSAEEVLSFAFKPLYAADDPIFSDALGNKWDEKENAALKERGQKYWRKRPSIHMPKRLARFRPPLIAVRVERVNDISEADAAAEGVRISPTELSSAVNTEDKLRHAFRRRWDSIHGKKPEYCFSANPFVWILEFPKYTTKEMT